jgi:hypothetical protein
LFSDAVEFIPEQESTVCYFSFPTLESIDNMIVGLNDMRKTFLLGRPLYMEEFETNTKKEAKMNFGQAIEALKEGKKVSREGWNGKNMWLVYMPPFRVEQPNERTQAHGIKDSFDCGGYIVMWTAKGVWQPGWSASQEDMFAEDWGVV